MYGTYHGAANALRPLMTGRFDSDPCSDPSALHFAAGICSGVPEAAIVTPFQARPPHASAARAGLLLRQSANPRRAAPRRW